MKRHFTVLTLTVIAAWLVGCVGEGSPEIAEADSLQQAIESPEGGFDTEDDEPMFGDEESFADLGLDEEDPAIDDERLAFGPEGRFPIPDEMRAVTVLVQWGQLRINPEVAEPTVWDGTISASEGGLIVRRVVRFEPRTDELLPRFDRQTVNVRSVTQPHNDGLILTLVLPPRDPSIGDDERPPALLVNLGEAREVVVPAAALADGFRAMVPVDRMGNVIVITTVPPHPCPHGAFAGLWREVRSDLGTFQGRWIGLDGELQGHLRGIWGVNREGHQVFFGKYIGRDGRFRGLVRGVWHDGELTGRWVDRSGRHLGGLRGQYRTAPEEAEMRADGGFGGHWIEACPDHECSSDRCPGEDDATDLPEELL
jgi:hypothetical protein